MNCELRAARGCNISQDISDDIIPTGRQPLPLLALPCSPLPAFVSRACDSAPADSGRSHDNNLGTTYRFLSAMSVCKVPASMNRDMQSMRRYTFNAQWAGVLHPFVFRGNKHKGGETRGPANKTRAQLPSHRLLEPYGAAQSSMPQNLAATQLLISPRPCPAYRYCQGLLLSEGRYLIKPDRTPTDMDM
ncbi:hypothetical protein N658DRAFT_201731 [Parathielavia hyrcaniae]|uniref:Uncharacterized protein n=1 Tax=Parathielavia hyrcaniae TaxID=113614 RepID=A0AAN6T4R8_9PEZI|nr:hypothetical protein N658DRAFT_201731 [Parathielavia hyrcaniae]